MNDARPGPVAAMVLRGVALYQTARAGRPTACRFHPSCSAYATEAIGTHGLVRGGALALRRLVRCTPLSRPGVDLVPPASPGAAR